MAARVMAFIGSDIPQVMGLDLRRKSGDVEFTDLKGWQMTGLNRRQLVAGALGTGSFALMNPLARAANAVRLTFVLVNDIYNMDEEGGRGGIARLGAVVKAERAKSGNVFFAHAGDTLSPSLMSGFDQGAHMIELFNALPPDIFVPGNHEFDFGPEVYLKRMGEAKFPVLAANLRDGNGSVLPHHRDSLIIERSGVKIGFVGATLDNTPNVSNSEPYRFSETQASVAAQSKALRAQGADIVVAVVHADKPTGQRLMASRVVDIVLSGHNHDLNINFDGKAALVESGEDAQYVVAMDVDVSVSGEGAARRVSWWPNFRVFDTKDVTPDPDLKARVARLEAELGRELDSEVASLSAALDSRTNAVRTSETSFGNLVADAARWQKKTELAIVNGGSIRGNRTYEAGRKITRRDILAELPFSSKTVRVEATGAQIRAAIENGLSRVEEAAGRFPQVSGLRIVADKTKPAGSRVISIEANGAPLDPARRYSLAINDFMLRGGDGYVSLADPKATDDSGNQLMANDVMAYARHLGKIDLKIEGRITFQ